MALARKTQRETNAGLLARMLINYSARTGSFTRRRFDGGTGPIKQRPFMNADFVIWRRDHRCHTSTSLSAAHSDCSFDRTPSTNTMVTQCFVTVNLALYAPTANRSYCAVLRACSTRHANGGTEAIRGARRRRRHFLNLSNGIEAAGVVSRLVGLEEVRVTRIQSSHCEAGAYDGILWSLGAELLFSLATGYECYVYDFGSRDSTRGVPRALFLGVQFATWALTYLWFDRILDCMPVRGKNVAVYWRDQVMPYQIEKKTKKMIRYYRPFAQSLAQSDVRIRGIYGAVTKLDGRMQEYTELVSKLWSHDKPAPRVDRADEDENDFEARLLKCGLSLYDPNSTAEQLVERQTHLQSIFRMPPL